MRAIADPRIRLVLFYLLLVVVVLGSAVAILEVLG